MATRHAHDCRCEECMGPLPQATRYAGNHTVEFKFAPPDTTLAAKMYRLLKGAVPGIRYTANSTGIPPANIKAWERWADDVEGVIRQYQEANPAPTAPPSPPPPAPPPPTPPVTPVQIPVEFRIDMYGERVTATMWQGGPLHRAVILLESTPRKETDYFELMLHCSVMGIPLHVAAKEVGMSPDHLRAAALRSLIRRTVK